MNLSTGLKLKLSDINEHALVAPILERENLLLLFTPLIGESNAVRLLNGEVFEIDTDAKTATKIYALMPQLRAYLRGAR